MRLNRDQNEKLTSSLNKAKEGFTAVKPRAALWMRMSDAVGAFSAVVAAILRSGDIPLPPDPTSPAGTTSDNKRLGDGKLASNTDGRLSRGRLYSNEITRPRCKYGGACDVWNMQPDANGFTAKSERNRLSLSLPLPSSRNAIRGGVV